MESWTWWNGHFCVIMLISNHFLRPGDGVGPASGAEKKVSPEGSGGRWSYKNEIQKV